ncbi:MvdD family ATP-grasp ribosomal peptide maturase [Pendulispora rubella]|uniref:MvdD family ATP-grasp ribosomal peptide maturase n=1 Tax=Pendulispora rubella TaxID=2741070 RepID=A0ABZ2L177_9BACT
MTAFDPNLRTPVGGRGYVLLCVRGEATEIPAVVAALRDRWNVDALLLDPTRFPNEEFLSIEYDREGASRTNWARGPLESEPILSVWQGIFVGAGLPAMEPGVRETCVAASEIAIVGFLENLQVFQLDPFWKKSRADNKPHQLGVAQRLGLDVPKTLITNDAAAVRAFAKQCGSMVTKALLQEVPTGPVDDAERSVFFTTEMTADALENLDGLELCPMIFQERIENRFDVRVTIVGNRIFSVAAEAGARGGNNLDWRRQAYTLDRIPRWSAYELPDGIGAKLLKMLDRFGLNYGAVDLIVTQEGRHVFLELNPSASFAFLGPSHTETIAGAIADVLVDPSARRVPDENA